MKLKIIFSGSCLFVPRRAGDGQPNRVHVVMPRSHGHHGDERHVPVLMFKAGYLLKDSTSAGEEWVTRSLTSSILTVPGLGADLRICPDILDLRPLVKMDVGSVLGADDDRKAIARVDLHVGKMERVARGACWEWEYKTPRRCAHVAEWVIDIPDQASVSLPLRPWNGPVPPPLPALHEIGGLVEVFVRNLPPADLDPHPETRHEPGEGDEAPHFGQYFRLFDSRVPEWRPRYAGKDDQQCAPVPGGCEEIPSTGGSPYNCMLAGLDLPPESWEM